MQVIIRNASNPGLHRVQEACRAARESPAWPPAARAVLGLVLAAVLCGCATTGTGPYPYFERLSIEALPPEPAEEGAAVASTGQLMAAGAAAGGVSTLATGFLASLLCGPYFMVCFAGTGAASLGGAAAGAVLAGSTALSEEDAERMIAALEEVQRTHNVNEELAAAVSKRLPSSRLAESGSADARLGLAVQGLHVATGFKDEVALGMVVKASLEWELDRAEPRQTSRNFECQSDARPLEEWLERHRTNPGLGLAECVDDLSEQIWTALNEPGIDPDDDFATPIGFGNYDPATADW
jgi:hypothetical protein